MALTVSEILMLRLQLDDRVEPFFLQDSEIQAIWTAAGESNVAFMLKAIDIILAVVAKLNDYTQNATTERKGQLMDHYLELRKIWKSRQDEDDAVTAGANQVRVFGARVMPKREKDKP